MTRLMMGITWFAVGVVTGVSAWASSPEPWERPSVDGERVGLVVVGTNEVGAAAEEVLVSKLDESEATVLREAAVDSTGHEATVERMEAMREEGSEKYFFEGMEPARDHLQKDLGAKLETTRPWMSDARASKALFETAIFLVRAYLDLGEEAEARRWMESVVAALPAHRPEGGAYPPAVVKLWEDVVDDLRAGGAALDLGALRGPSDCRAEINGEEVERERLFVAPNRMYVLGYRCGEDAELRHRWVGTAEGEDRAVEAFYAGLEKGMIEEKLARIADRRDLDTVVYVGPGSCDGGETCVGVYRQELRLQAFEESGVVEELVSVQYRRRAGTERLRRTLGSAVVIVVGARLEHSGSVG